MAPQIISVVGMLNADVFIVTDRMPEAGERVKAIESFDKLGGKGANTAIASYRTCHMKTCYGRLDGNGSDSRGKSASEASLGKETVQLGSTPAETESVDGDIQVQMIGAVGDDQYAQLFHDELEKNHVDTSGLRKISGSHSDKAHIFIERATRENRCIGLEGASAAWKKEDFMTVESLAHGPRPALVVAQLEVRKEVVQQAIETAGKAGIDFLLNAAPGEPIIWTCYKYITHLLMNESEAAIMSGRDLKEVGESSWLSIAQEFLNRGVRNVVITLGEKGAFFANADGHGHVQAYKVRAVDVTGAGDTFAGAYASEYLRQRALGRWDILSAVSRANKAAALTVGKMGAQDGIPWADEIDAFEAEFNVPTSHIDEATKS